MPKNKTSKELLEEAIERTNLLTANLPTLVDRASISHTAKIPYKTLCYREALIWRTEELSRTACGHFSSGELASAMTLTRAFVEGVAATWYLRHEIKKVLNTRSLGNFDNKAMRLLLGSKNDTSGLDAINVLTFLQAVEKKSPVFKEVMTFYVNMHTQTGLAYHYCFPRMILSKS